MSKRDRRVRQLDLVPRSKRATIDVKPTHRLVELTDRVDWDDLEARAELIRASKLKSAAGRPPHLRALLGAMLLMATRKMSYRDAEDQIRYYEPARYLCGLTETDWTPDFTTIQDFTELMGEEGIALINEYAVELAVAEKLADPKVMSADTTAQEAAIPWPNEMGLRPRPIRGVLPTRRFLPALTKRSRPARGRAMHRPRRGNSRGGDERVAASAFSAATSSCQFVSASPPLKRAGAIGGPVDGRPRWSSMAFTGPGCVR